MRDVHAIQKGSNACELSIVFVDEGGKENKNKPNEWELVTAHPEEEQRIIAVLSKLWQGLFAIPLVIEAKK